MEFQRLLFLLLLPLLFVLPTWAQIDSQSQVQEEESNFQYKNIVLAVVVDALSVPGLDIMRVEKYLFEMINNTIQSMNSNSYVNSNNFGDTGNNVTNMTRTSTISVITFEIDENFENIPEISILFSLLDCTNTHSLNKKIINRYGPVVHIAITDPGCPRMDSSSGLTIPLTWYAQNADLLQLLIDMRSDGVFPNWKEAIIINDVQSGEGIIDSFGQGFSSNLNYQNIAQTIYKVDSMSLTTSYSDQIEEILYKYSRSTPGKFIIITKAGNINRVLEVARRTKMLSILKQWIFIAPDPTGSEFRWEYVENRIIDDGVNVAFVMNATANSSEFTSKNQLFCNAEKITSLLSEVVESLAAWEFDLYLQVSNEEWDIIKPTRLDRVVNITATMTLNEKVLSICDKNSSNWNLRAAENGKLGKQVFEVGWWNPITGIRMTDDLLPHVTGGFRGRQISVASMHFPPWQTILRDEDGNVTYSGLMFEVLNHMSKDLNFSYIVLEPREGETWGHIQSDGSWTGMMKMVAENKVVIAAAAFTVTPERSQYVNFTEVLERESYGFMVNRPEELSRVLLFAAPFSLEVWICIIVTVIVVAPLLNIIHCLSYYYKFYLKVNDKGLFKMKNCYWYIYGSLLQQGGVHLPEAISGRMLIGFWWLFVIVTVTTYSGNLVAFLTFPKVESPVNTVDDLTHFRGVDSFGFLAGSVIEDHLKRSSDPQFEILYRKAIKHPTFNQTVLTMVSEKAHAYIDWKIVLLTAMREALRETGRCEYIIGSETFFEEKVALAVPRGSPYLPIFNKQISQMLQTGLIKKWKSRYWPQKDRCSQLIWTAGNRKVGIGDMQGSFYLLLFGFFIALIVLSVEIIIYRRRKQRLINTLKILVASNNPHQFWQQKQFPFLQ